MNLIELKEYQTLPRRKGIPLTEKEAKTVKKLETLSLVEEDLELKEKLLEGGILTISLDPITKEGLKVEPKSYIGIAQFTNFSVAIGPKFSNIKNLAKLIDYVYDLDLEIFPESETEFEGEKDLLSEIIISTFVNQCKNLLRKGMVKSYTTHVENTLYLRGKLLIHQQILNDAKTKLQFSCEHDEFEYNNIENQILLYCLEQSYKITINDQRKKEIRLLMQTIEGAVDYRVITLDDFKTINYNQMNYYYKKTHELCKLIVNGIRITNLFEQKTRFVNSFFVDMNKVFEKFVFKLFDKYYPRPCKEQQRFESLIFLKEKKKFNIITDILIFEKKREKILAIIDTKYKEEISPEDCYQIEHYIHDFDLKEGYAVLPEDESTTSDTINAKYQDISIQIRHINIDKTLDILYSKDEKSKEELLKNMLLEIISLPS